MENFLSFISEATLSVPELRKRPERIKILADFINNQKPLETTEGDRVISWMNPQNKVLYDNDDLESAFPRATAVFITDKGEKLKINNIIKSDAFGGGGGGSGAGASTTKVGESAQCVYLQVIWDNPKTEFTPEEISSAYDKVFVDATKESILELSDDWVTSTITSAKLLHRVLGKKKYSFHRGSAWVDKLGDYFNKSGQTYFSNINKWTPADIWMIDDTKLGNYDFEAGGAGAKPIGLPYLNQLLLKAYTNRDIIGVSLKKTTKAKLSQVNYKKPFKEPKFTRTTLGKRDFFKAKDGYIFGSGGLEMQFRTFPAFQAEIIGKTAKHGKLSGDGGDKSPIGLVMKSIGAKSIPKRDDITKMIRFKKDDFFKDFYNYYSQLTQKPVPLKNFISNLSNKDSGWLESKYLVCVLFSNIKGKEQLFLSRAFKYAKSQSDDSCVHLKVF